MERKIVKVGNSLAVIIPSHILEELELTYKDTVDLEYNKELQALVIRNKEKTTPNGNYLEQVVKGVVDDYLKEKGL